MSQLRIRGGKKLTGSVRVLGSKNAALPLLCASLLTDQTVTLRHIPGITDVDRMLRLLQDIGCDVERRGRIVRIRARTLAPERISHDIVGALRGSILLLGPLLGRFRRVVLPRPGGDIIGARPIDTHLDAFRQLGALVEDRGDTVFIDGTHLRAGTVTLREFSVTATENTLLVAALLPGVTTIHTAASEPHVAALGQLLTRMGASVQGAGTSSTITVRGVRRLRGADFTNVSDMLEAGFFILLAAATHSRFKVEDVPVDDLRLFFRKLDDINIDYRITGRSSRHVTVHPRDLTGFRMQSLPHPGIATDLQPPFSVIATQARGSSLIHDPLYEDRFRHIKELQKMGARAYVCDPHRVIIEGPVPLRGRTIPGLDIRSGATLIMAGLVASGETVIYEAEHIERGYENLPSRLQQLGARVVLES